MNLLTIDPQKIRVKIGEESFDLSGFPALPFEFTYIYYEPEFNHTRKVVNNGTDLVWADLTEDEILAIEELLSNTDDWDSFIVLPEVFVAPQQTVESVPTGLIANANTGEFAGIGPIVDGFVEVSSEPPAGKYDEFTGVVYRWDNVAKVWALQGGYKAQRKEEYLTQVNIGDQLGAIINAINALSAGNPLPQDFIEISDKIDAIKLSIPKE
jgi:hypothetical protein